jgi:hypothetical protein
MQLTLSSFFLFVPKGSDAIQGIMFDPSQHIKVVDWNGTAFEKMNCLRIQSSI